MAVGMRLYLLKLQENFCDFLQPGGVVVVVNGGVWLKHKNLRGNFYYRFK